MNGIRLALYFKLSNTSPRTKAISALCIPHPGHSTPKKLLDMQAIECASKKAATDSNQYGLPIELNASDPTVTKITISAIIHNAARLKPMIAHILPAFKFL